MIMKGSSKFFMVLTGLLFIVAGVLCIVRPTDALLSAAWIVGLLVLCSGVTSLVSWITLHFIIPRSSSLLLSSVLQIVMGVMMMNHNFTTAVISIYFLAALLLVEGLNVMMSGFAFKTVGFRRWWLISLLGVLLLAGGIGSFVYPMTSGQVVGIAFGVILLALGFFYFLSISAIRYVKKSFDRLR